MPANRELVIDGRRIADDTAPYIIAEIGHNHGGRVERAFQMAQIAVLKGASAVKFQTRHPKEVYQANAKKGAYFYESENPQWMNSRYGTHRELLEFTRQKWAELFAWCRGADITAFSTPFDFKSADLLAEISVPAFKIASGDATNLPLIQYVASFGKPVIVSTGGCSMVEVEQVAQLLDGKPHAILQCSCIYPAPDDVMNLRVIESYRNLFPDTVIGLSTHNPSWHTSLAAIALGARIIEHHFTVNKTWKGTDNAFSLDPSEMAEFVKASASVVQALGSSIKAQDERERLPTIERRKSIVAAQDIAEGETVSRHHLTFKCPGDGLSPAALGLVVGKQANRTIKAEELVTAGDVR